VSDARLKEFGAVPLETAAGVKVRDLDLGVQGDLIQSPSPGGVHKGFE
jgi:hypothetical protein